MGDMSMVAQQNHGQLHQSSNQVPGGGHQFMPHSYPYHHHTSGSYPATTECIDYSKDSAWKFQVL